MRIDRNGNVGLGTTAPRFKFEVNGQIINTAAYNGLNNLDQYDIGVGSIGVSGAMYSYGRICAGNYSGSCNSGGGVVIEGSGSNVYGNVYLSGGGNSFFNGGNVGIGTTAPNTKLHVVGDVTVTGNIAAKYQDIAEWVPASRAIPAGTVVVLDPARSNHVLPSSRSYDTGVAGVISSQPGVILGEAGAGKVKVATTGRVKVKVDASRAPIRVGDLLVTSDREGVAMRSVPVNISGVEMHRPGTLIGKALEPLEKGTGEILVLLSLQ